MAELTQNPYVNSPEVEEKTEKKEEFRLLSRFQTILFLFLAAYMVVPLGDIPILGLSLSTPVTALLVLELLTKNDKWNIRQYMGWIVLLYLFYLGIILSLFAHNFMEVFEYNAFDQSEVLWLIRFAFWLTSCLLVIIVVSSDEFIRNRINIVIGLSIAGLCALRMGEAIFGGKWGASMETGITTIMSQNNYGIQFSSFGIYALHLALTTKNRYRPAAIGLLILVIIAVVVNGSRGSWLGLMTAAVVYAIIYASAGAKRILQITASIAILYLIGNLAWPYLPAAIRAPAESRFSTLEDVENDKSYMGRVLMVEKSMKIFDASPYFGTGIGRFRQTFIQLDLPEEFRHHTQARFNKMSAHNSYMSLLAETGLAGTIPYAMIFVTLVVGGGLATLQHVRAGEMWVAPIYASFIGMSLHLWALSGLAGTGTWFVYGLVGAIITHRLKEY